MCGAWVALVKGLAEHEKMVGSVCVGLSMGCAGYVLC